ncbi:MULTISPECIES: hypothetical protein [Glaesserella]|uniref:DUF6892 domain-containing protein n=1 Tax=Glaesserella australis TaxID=2094024 RepID=A0A328BXF1_9PAST|nr:MULTISPECIES: hypothetical protein [Glaesserella]AUI66605.1 hypothetical protein CJD39_08485 [Glaesserella sp. 15-184]RAL18779.1 hypothetical protein C5N92_06510 [Glaesserella australis]
MLNNIIKIAAVGLVGVGLKKIYDNFIEAEQDKDNEKNDEKRNEQSVEQSKETKITLETVVQALHLDKSIPLSAYHFQKDGYSLSEAAKEKDPMMKLMALAGRESLDQEPFYQYLKMHLPEASKKWSDEQKNEFVGKVLSTFEGAFRWDYYHAEHPANILDMCNAKGKMRDCLRFVAELFPDVEQGKRLSLILKEVERIQNRLKNPIYNKNQTPSVKFQDIRLKFAIIQQLMATGELKPAFDHKLFAEEFTYFLEPAFPSSEAGDYMLNLDISQYQLNQISELYLNHYSGDFSFLHLPSSVTGDMSIHYFDYRNRPADIMPMTTNVIKDLALLPNLKYLYLPKDKPFEIIDIGKFGLCKLSDGTYSTSAQGIKIDNLTLPKAFIKALHEKGITVYHGGTELDFATILNNKNA